MKYIGYDRNLVCYCCAVGLLCYSCLQSFLISAVGSKQNRRLLQCCSYIYRVFQSVAYEACRVASNCVENCVATHRNTSSRVVVCHGGFKAELKNLMTASACLQSQSSSFCAKTIQCDISRSRKCHEAFRNEIIVKIVTTEFDMCYVGSRLNQG